MPSLIENRREINLSIIIQTILVLDLSAMVFLLLRMKILQYTYLFNAIEVKNYADFLNFVAHTLYAS